MPVSLTRTYLQRALLMALVAGACSISGWGLVAHSKLALIPVGILAALALMAIFSAIGLKALWLWPPLGVVMSPFSSHLGNKYVTFDRVWVGGMVVLLLTLPKVRAHARASRRMLIALALLTAVIGVRSALTSYGSLYPVRIWVDSLVIPLILFSLVRRAVGLDERLAERVAFSLVVAGLLLALIGIAEHLGGFSLAKLAGGTPRFDSDIGQVRISGPYGDPEPYGLALISCLAASMYWLLARPRTGWLRFAVLGVVGLEVVAIFFTYFRVGWIGALLVLLAAVGFRPGRYGRAIATLLVAALVAVPVVVAFESSSTVTDRVDNTQNIWTRFAIYDQAWQIFKGAPVFGVGAQRYNDVAAPLPTVYVHNQPSQPYPHSSFFEVLAEDGVVGFIALLFAAAGIWGLVHALRRAARSSPDAVLVAVLAAASLSYLIYSATLEMLPYSPPNELFAILLGLAAGRLDALSRPRTRPRAPTLNAT
jgi:O-antigen ligase